MDILFAFDRWHPRAGYQNRLVLDEFSNYLRPWNTRCAFQIHHDWSNVGLNVPVDSFSIFEQKGKCLPRDVDGTFLSANRYLSFTRNRSFLNNLSLYRTRDQLPWLVLQLRTDTALLEDFPQTSTHWLDCWSRDDLSSLVALIWLKASFSAISSNRVIWVDMSLLLCKAFRGIRLYHYRYFIREKSSSSCAADEWINDDDDSRR